MSIAEFGSSVDEVQQKLSEILPLVDSGEDAAEQLHGKIEASGPKLAATLERIAESAGADDTVVEQLATKFNTLETDVAEAWADVSKQVDEFSDNAQTAASNLDSARLAIEQDQQKRETNFAEALTKVESGFAGVREVTRSLLGDINKTQQSYLNSQDALMKTIGDTTEEHFKVNKAIKERLSKTREDNIPKHKTEADASLATFEEMATKLDQDTEKAVQDARREMASLLTELASDIGATAAEFETSHKASVDELGSNAEETASAVNEKVATFGEEAATKIGTEIKETQAVVEAANVFAKGTSQIRDGVAAAKQDAETINDSI